MKLNVGMSRELLCWIKHRYILRAVSLDIIRTTKIIKFIVLVVLSFVSMNVSIYILLKFSINRLDDHTKFVYDCR